jgi:hypothetical protein
MARQLHHQLADGRARGGLQKPVAGLNPDLAHEQQRGEGVGGELASRGVIQAVGNRDNLGSGHHYELLPGTGDEDSDDALADPEGVHARSDRLDHADALRAQHGGERGRVAVAPAQDVQVAGVDGGGVQPDHDLALAGFARWSRLETEHIGRFTDALGNERPHGCGLGHLGPRWSQGCASGWSHRSPPGRNVRRTAVPLLVTPATTETQRRRVAESGSALGPRREGRPCDAGSGLIDYGRELKVRSRAR